MILKSKIDKIDGYRHRARCIKILQNAFVIDDAENLGDVIIDNLTNLLGNSKS